MSEYFAGRAGPVPIAPIAEQAAEITRLRADLLRITRERDRLIDRWIRRVDGEPTAFVLVTADVYYSKCEKYEAAVAAVRRAAGLDEEGSSR